MKNRFIITAMLFCFSMAIGVNSHANSRERDSFNQTAIDNHVNDVAVVIPVAEHQSFVMVSTNDQLMSVTMVESNSNHIACDIVTGNQIGNVMILHINDPPFGINI